MNNKKYYKNKIKKLEEKNEQILILLKIFQDNAAVLCNMLGDVIDELNLSDINMKTGITPAQLVRFVLDQKDKK